MELTPKQKTFLQQNNYIEILRETLKQKQMIDEHNNLNLEHSSDQDFLDMFFKLKVFNKEKEPSKHTLRAYRQDLQVILDFLNRHQQTFKSIGFVVVKTFNHEMREMYANRSDTSPISTKHHLLLGSKSLRYQRGIIQTRKRRTERYPIERIIVN